MNHQQGNAFLSGVLRDALQDIVTTMVLEAWDGGDQQQMRSLTDLSRHAERSQKVAILPSRRAHGLALIQQEKTDAQFPWRRSEEIKGGENI